MLCHNFLIQISNFLGLKARRRRDTEQNAGLEHAVDLKEIFLAYFRALRPHPSSRLPLPLSLESGIAMLPCPVGINANIWASLDTATQANLVQQVNQKAQNINRYHNADYDGPHQQNPVINRGSAVNRRAPSNPQSRQETIP